MGNRGKIQRKRGTDNRRVTVDPSQTEIIVNDVVEKWADMDLPVVKTDQERVDEAKGLIIHFIRYGKLCFTGYQQ